MLSLGASLSQDRGRLESRIEILTGEVTSLKKQLQVKSCQIYDFNVCTKT